VGGTAVGSWHGSGSEVHCTGGCVGGIGGHCGVGGWQAGCWQAVIQDACFGKMEKMCKSPKPHALPFHVESNCNDFDTIDLHTLLKDNAGAVVLDFKSMFINLLEDPMFVDFDNLIADPDDPFGKPIRTMHCDPNEPRCEHFCAGYCSSGDVMNNMCKTMGLNPNSHNFIIPLIFFMNKTETSPNMRWGAEPVMFALSLLKELIRNKRSCIAWHLLEHVNDCLRLAASKAKGSSSKNRSGCAAQNCHKTLSMILKSFEDATELLAKKLTWVQLGDKIKQCKIHLRVCFVVGDVKSQDANTGNCASCNTNRLCRACHCKQIDASKTDKVCAPMEQKTIEALTAVVFDDNNDNTNLGDKEPLTEEDESHCGDHPLNVGKDSPTEELVNHNNNPTNMCKVAAAKLLKELSARFASLQAKALVPLGDTH